MLRALSQWNSRDGATLHSLDIAAFEYWKSLHAKDVSPRSHSAGPPFTLVASKPFSVSVASCQHPARFLTVGRFFWGPSSETFLLALRMHDDLQSPGKEFRSVCILPRRIVVRLMVVAF